MANPHPEQPARKQEGQERVEPAPKALAGNGDSTAASLTLLADLHGQSNLRDRQDIVKDRQAIHDDRDGLAAGRTTMKTNNDAIRELLKTGTLSPQTIERLKKAHGASTSSDQTDITGSQEFSGTAPPDGKAVQKGIDQAQQIGTLAKELSGNPSSERRAEILKQMGSAAGDIEKLGVGDKSVIGKDASDAGKESAVISADIAKLGTMDPKSPLYQKLIADIGSKAGLIGRELGDIKDEQGFIAHDNKDIAKDNAIIKAINDLPQGKTGWPATEQLIKLLQDDNRSKRETQAARRDDIATEPGYIAADAADVKLNTQILTALGQNPYPPEKNTKK